MEKLCCTKCGKENITEGARFCAFCGGELGEKNLPAAEQTAKLCASLKNTYINYINWSSDYLASRSAGTILAGMFTGNSDYHNRDEHKTFSADCESAAAALCAVLTPGASCPELTKLLNYILFDVHDHCGDEAGWMILACEKFCLPLLDFLPPDEAAQLYQRYKAFRKKKMNLPAQDEMLRKLKKLSKKR